MISEMSNLVSSVLRLEDQLSIADGLQGQVSIGTSRIGRSIRRGGYSGILLWIARSVILRSVYRFHRR